MKKIIIALVCLSLAACSSHKMVKPTLSGLELQQLQTKEYEAAYDITFRSVMSVLQDAGYVLENADIETGFITGKSPTNTNNTYNLWWGFQSKQITTKVSSTVEKIGENYAKVRLNFVAIDDTSRGLYGNARVDTPIEDPKIYQNVFEKIDETIFIKMSTQ